MFNWVVDKAWCFSAYKSVNGGFKLQVLEIFIVSLLLLLLLSPTCTICTICTCKTCQFLNMCQTARSQSHTFQFATWRDWAGFCVSSHLVCVNISDAEVFIEEHSDVSYFVCVFVCLGVVFQRRPAYHFHYRFPQGEFTSREIIHITLYKENLKSHMAL